MHKLVRRSPSSLASPLPLPPPLSTSTLPSLGFFKNTFMGLTNMPPLPKLTSLKDTPLPFFKNAPKMEFGARTSCGVCSCSVGEFGRSWVMSKECKGGGSGARGAWFKTLAGGDEGVLSSDEENVGGGGEVGGVQRRERGGGGVSLRGNPDLLTIPGVGPRNLRKLVEKGFDGVDQLKQFYRDKV